MKRSSTTVAACGVATEPKVNGGRRPGSGRTLLIFAASAALAVGAATFSVAAVTNAAPVASPAPAIAKTTAPIAGGAAVDPKALLTRYCQGCHNDTAKAANMSVAGLDPSHVGANGETWEKILRRVSLGEMPPKGMARPDKVQIATFTGWLEDSLDTAAAENPNPGHVILRRLNRVEYANAVRDLLDLDVDVADSLPADDSAGFGFDNIADALTVSPALMGRYMVTAGRVAKLATGTASKSPAVTVYQVPKDTATPPPLGGIASFNERSSDLLPLASRGGGAFKFYAPYDAEYDIQFYLNANTRQENERLAHNRIDLRLPLKAGVRVIGVSFPREMSLDESLTERFSGRRPQVPYGGDGVNSLPPDPPMLDMDIHLDGVTVKRVKVPAWDATVNYLAQYLYLRDVHQITVVGPHNPTGIGKTASREKIFTCYPTRSAEEARCARKIVSTLAHQAYRRPVTSAEVASLMKLYEMGRTSGGSFDSGVGAAVEGVLVSPKFLFMAETPPAKAKPGALYALSDLEYATRLAMFLWSSIPDDELLSVAEKGQLKRPEVLERQVARMLADPKAKTMTTKFASQWLHLTRMDGHKPNAAIFPKISNLIKSDMVTETQMFVDSVLRENRPVMDLLTADYSFLNRRMAEYYGVTGVQGPAFRRVSLAPSTNRGGLLGQGSILLVTSYDNRTSPVLRGKWILDNILAAPPPPPPPNVPDLMEAQTAGKMLTIREQMETHRANPVCASCHNKMDPLGLALENYDGVGLWRDTDAGKPIDVTSVLPDGTPISGVNGLKAVLVSRKEQFVEAFTERMMTYALGRGVNHYDMPAIRKIRDEARPDDFRINSIILGIVQSLPFTTRKAPEA